MQEKILNLPASKIANFHRSMLKECTMKEENPELDPRAGDSANAGENKNDGKESKTNKTEKNKTKKETRVKIWQGVDRGWRLVHNFLIY